jgi:predicted nuclease of predicted toxin-antitoxin system
MPEGLRLYLDQMLQTKVVQVLRRAGYDVLRATETGQSRADDQEILRLAINQKRILVTLDEHFGDWAVLPLTEHFGVVRVKVNPTTSENILNILMPFLERISPKEIQNHLVIVSASREKWISTA